MSQKPPASPRDRVSLNESAMEQKEPRVGQRHSTLVTGSPGMMRVARASVETPTSNSTPNSMGRLRRTLELSGTVDEDEEEFAPDKGHERQSSLDLPTSPMNNMCNVYSEHPGENDEREALNSFDIFNCTFSNVPKLYRMGLKSAHQRLVEVSRKNNELEKNMERFEINLKRTQEKTVLQLDHIRQSVADLTQRMRSKRKVKKRDKDSDGPEPELNRSLTSNMSGSITLPQSPISEAGSGSDASPGRKKTLQTPPKSLENLKRMGTATGSRLSQSTRESFGTLRDDSSSEEDGYTLDKEQMRLVDQIKPIEKKLLEQVASLRRTLQLEVSKNRENIQKVQDVISTRINNDLSDNKLRELAWRESMKMLPKWLHSVGAIQGQSVEALVAAFRWPEEIAGECEQGKKARIELKSEVDGMNNRIATLEAEMFEESEKASSEDSDSSSNSDGPTFAVGRGKSDVRNTFSEPARRSTRKSRFNRSRRASTGESLGNDAQPTEDGGMAETAPTQTEAAAAAPAEEAKDEAGEPGTASTSSAALDLATGRKSFANKMHRSKTCGGTANSDLGSVIQDDGQDSEEFDPNTEEEQPSGSKSPVDDMKRSSVTIEDTSIVLPPGSKRRPGIHGIDRRMSEERGSVQDTVSSLDPALLAKRRSRVGATSLLATDAGVHHGSFMGSSGGAPKKNVRIQAAVEQLEGQLACLNQRMMARDDDMKQRASDMDSLSTSIEHMQKSHNAAEAGTSAQLVSFEHSISRMQAEFSQGLEKMSAECASKTGKLAEEVRSAVQQCASQAIAERAYLREQLELGFKGCEQEVVEGRTAESGASPVLIQDAKIFGIRSRLDVLEEQLFHQMKELEKLHKGLHRHRFVEAADAVGKNRSLPSQQPYLPNTSAVAPRLRALTDCDRISHVASYAPLDKTMSAGASYAPMEKRRSSSAESSASSSRSWSPPNLPSEAVRQQQARGRLHDFLAEAHEEQQTTDCESPDQHLKPPERDQNLRFERPGSSRQQRPESSRRQRLPVHKRELLDTLMTVGAKPRCARPGSSLAVLPDAQASRQNRERAASAVVPQVSEGRSIERVATATAAEEFERRAKYDMMAKQSEKVKASSKLSSMVHVQKPALVGGTQVSAEESSNALQRCDSPSIPHALAPPPAADGLLPSLQARGSLDSSAVEPENVPIVVPVPPSPKWRSSQLEEDLSVCQGRSELPCLASESDGEKEVVVAQPTGPPTWLGASAQTPLGEAPDSQTAQEGSEAAMIQLPSREARIIRESLGLRTPPPVPSPRKPPTERANRRRSGQILQQPLTTRRPGSGRAAEDSAAGEVSSIVPTIRPITPVSRASLSAPQ